MTLSILFLIGLALTASYTPVILSAIFHSNRTCGERFIFLWTLGIVLMACKFVF